MAGSSILSSTWMLPLLLLSLFIAFNHSTSFHGEFDNDLDIFKKSVEECSNCSSTLGKCQCLNYSMSTVDCGFPGYFIEGLKLLSSSFHDKTFVRFLIGALRDRKDPALNDTSFCFQTTHPIISPKCLHKQLEHVKQYINDKSSNKELSSSTYVPLNC